MEPWRDFTLIVQGPDAAGRERCRGFADGPVVVPARVWVVGAPGMGNEAYLLTERLWAAVSGLANLPDHCPGPCGVDCWATSSPVAHNVLVVVCGGPPPDPAIDDLVRDALGQGLVVVGVLPETEDPQIALPPSLRSSVALRFQRSSTEVTEEIVDLLLLAGEERRAFISYAHLDGSQLAFDVFDALARRRFDVYLDRFRTTPSTDFVERIDDELRDKAMVVVIETDQAVMSAWVFHEIMTARLRGYGLLAINVGGEPEHWAIPAARRLSLPAFDEIVICAEIERHYRAAVVDQRRRRSAALKIALERAAAGNHLVGVVSSGERCDLVGGAVGAVNYSVWGAFRPAGVREARHIAELAEVVGRRPVLYCPRPTRRAGRDDLGWIGSETPVAVVPDGRLLQAARKMVQGTL